MREEIGRLVIDEKTPLHLKSYLLSFIKFDPSPVYVGYLSDFIKNNNKIRLSKLAIDSLSQIDSYSSEEFLRNVLLKGGEPLSGLAKKALSKMYKNPKFLFYSYLDVQDEKGKNLRAAVNFFSLNPDPSLCPYLLRIIANSSEERVKKIIVLIEKCGCKDNDTFEFLKAYIERIILKPVKSELLQKLFSVFSSVFKDKKSDIEKFLKELKSKSNDALLHYIPYALIPLEDVKYKKFYEDFFMSKDLNKRLFSIKNLPERKESWILKLLYDGLNSSNYEVSSASMDKIFKIGAIDSFITVVEKGHERIKKLFLERAIEKGVKIPEKLVEKFLFDEPEDIAILAVEYIKRMGLQGRKIDFVELFYKGFSIEFKRRLLTLITDDKKLALLVISSLVENRRKGVLRGLEKPIVIALGKLYEKHKLTSKERFKVIDLMLLLFEESKDSELLITVLYVLKKITPHDKKELEFLLGELSDKSRSISMEGEELSDVLKEIHKTKVSIEEKAKRSFRKAELNEKLKIFIRELKNDKNAIFKIRDSIMLIKDELEISKREKEFLSKYVLSEVINPFQKRERVSAMLDVITYLRPEGSIEVLKNFIKNAPSELLLKVKSTLIALGVKEEEFFKGKKSWYKVLK